LRFQRVLCFFAVLLLVGTVQAGHYDAKAPVAARTQAAPAMQGLDRLGFADPAHGDLSEPMPEQPAQGPNIPPEEGRVWLLAQGIQYPPASVKSCGPLCYQNTRKVIAGTEEFFVAGWETGAESDNEVMTSLWDIFFGLWTNPEPVSESYSDAGRIYLVPGPDGTIHACWHQDHTPSQTTYEVFYAQLPSGALTWTDPVMVSTQDATESNFPTMGVDNANNVTVKWSQFLRDASGNILDYQGYRAITSTDGGQTWDTANIEVVSELGYLWGAMCVDPVSGDIYVVDNDVVADAADDYADLLVTHYDAATGIWEGPEILVYGGGVGETFHDITDVSCCVGPDGMVHILYNHTTQPQAGYIWIDQQVGAPIGGMPTHVYGTYGDWSEPEPVYPWTDGIYEGIEGLWADSTSYFFCGYAQIATDEDNKLYVGTRAYEYWNAGWVTGNDDMHSDLGGGTFQPEVFIGCKDLTRDDEWVWTRASDVNLRPDSIGIKYTKLTAEVPTTGPAVVWDETYNGAQPSRVLFTRITDFTSPGPVANLQASRPEVNGPVTLTWENPVDEDLKGLLIVRDPRGMARLGGLRRGTIPINADSEFLYGDVWIVEADTLTGVIEPIFYDDEAPEGTVYYTVVPYDEDYHHYYPIDEELAVVQVDSIAISGDVATMLPRTLQLEAVQPNPVVSNTEIRYSVPSAGDIRIAVYDVSGRLVSTVLQGEVSEGTGAVHWNAADDQGRPLGNGVYLCRLEQGGSTTSRNFVVLR
jgi:hypothetical protein